jgi:glycosyltransferase involved in cell wall biosynthesis
METSINAREWPRVSVIIPSYNQGSFIRQTLDSVLTQGYPDLELIVVDGASTDDTVEILREYESRLAYWVSEPDNGQSHAINKGFARATGSLVGWLNSDDLYLSKSLFRAASYLMDRPECDVVFSDYIFIDELGELLKRRREIPFDFATYLWTRDCYHANCAGMFRRQIFEETGGLRQDLDYSMDYEFYLRLASQGFRVDHVREFWGAYRFHKESKSVADNESQIRESMEVASVYSHDVRAPWLRGPFYSAKRKLLKLLTGCYRPWERL